VRFGNFKGSNICFGILKLSMKLQAAVLVTLGTAQSCYKASRNTPNTPNAPNQPSGPSTTTNPPPAINAGPLMGACLPKHNEQRNNDGVGPLTWDSLLESSAQTYANVLARDKKFEHSHTNGVGENLYSGGGCEQAVAAWVSEKDKFTSGKIDGDFAKYGHYTQVVWRGTTSVGCGVAVGIVVCQYSK
jgi:uncharacterized protein YkwD